MDEEAAKEDAITIVVQINGKLRDRLMVAPGTPDAEIERLALASEKVRVGAERQADPQSDRRTRQTGQHRDGMNVGVTVG